MFLETLGYTLSIFRRLNREILLSFGVMMRDSRQYFENCGNTLRTPWHKGSTGKHAFQAVGSVYRVYECR